MTDALTPNTQAILLLTAPLVQSAAAGHRPLSASEYSRLATHLRALGRAPADLLHARVDAVLRDCQAVLDPARARGLLARGFALSQAVARWNSRAIWVVSRADPEYPRRLKGRMLEAAPAVLYGAGDARLLATGGLALVGSRERHPASVAYGTRVGELLAHSRESLLVRGARDDHAALRAALRGGGRAIVVLHDGLESAALDREHRDGLLSRSLLLVSAHDPGASPVMDRHAVQPDTLLYALADAALVVDAELDGSGAWARAKELRHLRVYVRSSGAPSAELDALGAAPWPNPTSTDALGAALRGVAPAEPPAD